MAVEKTMSNLTRYTCVANDHDAMEANPDGEYVRFDYANLRIVELEQRIDNIRGVISKFNNGAQIISSDGCVLLTVDEYNSLVDAVNVTLGGE